MWDLGHCPLSVIDANGMVVLRAITAFDPETGEVESQVRDENGEAYIDADDNLILRTEKFPAPLIWKKLDDAQLKQERVEVKLAEAELRKTEPQPYGAKTMKEVRIEQMIKSHLAKMNSPETNEKIRKWREENNLPPE